MEFMILFLAAVALVLLFIVCGKKGFRSLFSLGLTVVILLALIVPAILSGHNPVVVILIAALPIIALIIYITEGFTTLSHISVVAIILNFIITSLLIFLAVHLAHLTGIVSQSENDVLATGIDPLSLLTSGMILGTLGVLVEMVVTQVATVMEFLEADPQIESAKLFSQTYSVGVAHLGSIINTLFLIYAAISLPTILLLAGGHSTVGTALNYEPLASDIIRTLCGVIGLIIAMPTSTALAVRWVGHNKKG